MVVETWHLVTFSLASSATCWWKCFVEKLHRLAAIAHQSCPVNTKNIKVNHRYNFFHMARINFYTRFCFITNIRYFLNVFITMRNFEKGLEDIVVLFVPNISDFQLYWHLNLCRTRFRPFSPTWVMARQISSLTSKLKIFINLTSLYNSRYIFILTLLLLTMLC